MRRASVASLIAALTVGLLLPTLPAHATSEGANGLIAFGKGDVYEGSVWVSEEDGTHPTWVADGWHPTWSPDGLRLAYVAPGSGGTWTRIDVWDVTTGVTETVYETQDGSGVGSPTFSPDGSRIAFVEGGSRVLILDGVEITEMLTPDDKATTLSFADGTPDVRYGTSWVAVWWSPLPDTLFVYEDFIGTPSSTYAELVTVTTDGEILERMLFRNLGDIDFSPDGMSAAVAISPTPLVGSGSRLDITNADLTPGITLLGDEGSHADYSSPAWAPDSGSIVFKCHPGMSAPWELPTPCPDEGLYRVPPDGETGPVVVIECTNCGSVSWQAVAPVPLVHVDTTTGIWMLRDGSGYVHDFYYGNPGDIPVMGDWTCDGETTPGLYRPSDGYAYLRNTNTQGNADRTFYFGNPGDIPLAGDWNGDGCDTLSIYRPATQEFHIINHLGAADTGLGAAETSFVFGNPGDTPVVGDWDGDGIDEIGLYRESSGYFYYRDTLTTGIADGQFYYGNPNDRFIAGDWNGNGHDTPAIYRPTMNRFYFKDTLTTGPADHTFTWGNPTWTPLTGTFQLP